MRQKWADAGSALAGLEAPVRLIDDVDAPLAAHDAIIAVAAAQGFQRIADFHGISFCLSMIFSENRYPLFGIMLCRGG
jgi:hypothetical protein